MSREKEVTKTRHIKKLEKLMDRRKERSEATGYNLRPEGLQRWVVNLSEHELSEDQKSVLRLGLNFTPAPRKLPLIDTMAGVEIGARKLRMDEASELRGKVCGVLRKAKVPKDNLSSGQRRALNELSRMEDVAILPADKGNAQQKKKLQLDFNRTIPNKCTSLILKTKVEALQQERK